MNIRKTAFCFALFVVFLLSGNARFASAQSQYRQLITGRDWESMVAMEKSAFIAGYMESSAFWQGEAEESQVKDSISTGLPIKLAVGEIVENLNSFYGEPTNRPVKIIMALTWVRMKSEGASPEELRKYEDHLRASNQN